MQKPRLSFWQIWNMSFGFLGIQFGWGLQMANMSAIYQYLHAKESDLPVLWLAAPLTGLLVQPIIGYASDRTWCRLGRRRPYFLVGAILASLALVAMPMSGTVWMAAGLLWVLDASVNITMEPFRAFVGDLLPVEQRKSGFAMQSLLIGLGAVLSSALPYILANGFGVSGEATVKSPIPPSIALAFYIGSAVFFAAVLYTITTTPEYPPENIAEFQKMKAQSAGFRRAFVEIIDGIVSMPKAMRPIAMVQFFTWFALFCMWIYFVPAVASEVFHGKPLGLNPKAKTQLHTETGKHFLTNAAAIAKAYDARKKLIAKQEQQDASARPWYAGLLQMFGLNPAAADPGERMDKASLRNLIAQHLGSTDPLSAEDAESPLVQTFATALLTHNIEGADSPGISDAAAQLHRELALARTYQKGASWGGVCFSTYNGTAFLFAFILLWLVRKLPARAIHRWCLIYGGVGLIMAFAFHRPHLLIGCMVLVGMAWASILSMPYAMLANAIPAQKMGFYMGVFNFFIVIPQIIASLGLGSLMKYILGGNPMNAVLVGGCSMLVAAACVSLVPRDVDRREEGDPVKPELTAAATSSM